MFEFDFLPVGDGENSGDAIALRYTTAESGHVVTGIIDAGFEDDGQALVEHVRQYYNPDGKVDFVVSTHPDSDHINGMGHVMRELEVGTLLIHRPALHGYPGNSGARPTEELVQLAERQGTKVVEPFQGAAGFGGSLVVAGPTVDYYERMLALQETSTKEAASRSSFAERYFGSVGGAVATLARKALQAFPVEIPFGDAGGTNPRNNSAVILKSSRW